jgi:hypothetical protein
MARSCLLLLIFICGASLFKVNAQDKYDNRVLTPVQMQQDFDQLRHTLEATHPGLYKYTDKPTMQHKMDSLRSLLNQPLSFYRFYQVIATLIADVKCEHTSCTMYHRPQLGEHLMEWKVIPFIITFVQGKAYVVINRTSDTTIHLGDEVCQINHQDADSLEHALYQYVPTEGDITTNKDAFLSEGPNFIFWYAMFISRPDRFDMVFRSPDGKMKERIFQDSLTFKGSYTNTIKNPANKWIIEKDKANQREQANPWRLKIAENKQYAVMSLDGFGNGFDKDKKRMAERFAEFFAKLKKEKIPNLIINLANNPGGDEANAAELFSYLISEPKHFINDEYLINIDDEWLKKVGGGPADLLTNKYKYFYPERDGKYYVKEETQGELPICQPKADRFTGKVYFFISGRTASAASTFAAVCQSNHIGKFIGQETGGTYFGGGSTIGINMTLPNSGITTHTSINYCDFATTGNHNPGRGVIPDYPYDPSFKERLGGDKVWEDYIVKIMAANN